MSIVLVDIKNIQIQNSDIIVALNCILAQLLFEQLHYCNRKET